MHVMLPAQEGQSAAVAQRGGDIRERCGRIIEEHDTEAADHYIAGCLAQRAGLSVGLHESDVRYACLLGELARDLQHWARQIQANSVTAGTEFAVPGCAGRRDCRRTAAAANIQHPFSRRDGYCGEQMREEMLLLGQVPLAVGDPVTAALTVPPLSLGR